MSYCVAILLLSCVALAKAMLIHLSNDYSSVCIITVLIARERIDKVQVMLKPMMCKR